MPTSLNCNFNFQRKPSYRPPFFIGYSRKAPSKSFPAAYNLDGNLCARVEMVGRSLAVFVIIYSDHADITKL